MSVEVDLSELRTLQESLEGVPSRVAPKVRKAVEVTARHIKDDARNISRAQVGRHGRLYPYTMEYDLKDQEDSVTADIGPRPGGQGDLAPIFETGNPYSGHKQSLEPVLLANRDDFYRGLLKAISEVVIE